MVRRLFRLALWSALFVGLVLAWTKVRKPPQPVLPQPAPGGEPWPRLAEEPAVEVAEADARTWIEPTGDMCPTSHPVKASVIRSIFHVPGGASYDRVKPERCYRTPADAEADGLRAAKR